MIDSLFKTDFAGKDGFTWWFGRVANKSVWKDTNVVMSQKADSYGQRVKVRIIGYHPFNGELAEEDLPWATVMMDPITGSGQGGMGDAMTLVGGETCIGFFMDGEEAQQPIIMGLINRHNGIENSVSEEELKNNKSSGFKNSTGGNENLSTKRKSVIAQKVKPPQSPPQKGIVETNAFDPNAPSIIDTGISTTAELTTSSGDPGKGKTEGGVIAQGGFSSDAAKCCEKNATSYRINPSNCKNDSIGQITQVLTDFISLTNSLESAMGKFVDPIENLIYDMDAELRRIIRQVEGLIKGVLNDVRDGILGKLSFLFSQFLGTLNLVNPFEFISDEASRLAYQGIMDLIFCIFENLLSDLGDFLMNMFSTVIENVVNGPVCAAEQFVSSIFAKVFDTLENVMEPVLSGLDWLVGGIGVISDFIGKASNLASEILRFIGCDGKKCTTPSKWASTLSGSIDMAADDWETQVSNINVLKGVSADLTKISEDAGSDIDDFFGSDEFQQTEYNGMQLSSVLSATDQLTGGNSAEALDKGLGSIESAITTTSLFGDSSIFNSCTETINNPTEQSDIISMPLGFVFDKCITPEIAISGSGSGASATPIVNESGKIIATEIKNRGSGYTSNTEASIIDNTNNGHNAELKVLVEDGKVSQIVVVQSGFGYCPNVAPIVPNPVGIITAIYVDKPGIGYTIGDSILIPLPRIIDDTTGDGTVTGPGFPDSPLPLAPVTLVPIDPETPGSIDAPTQPGIIRDGPNPGYIVAPIPTPGNGSIIDVKIPINLDAEYNFIPKIIINSRNGVGANLIPILTYKQLDNVDTSGVERSGLVGITSVIDCI